MEFQQDQPFLVLPLFKFNIRLALLAYGLHPTTVGQLVAEAAKMTFKNYESGSWNLTKARYSSKWFKLALNTILPEKFKMRDLKKKLLIPAWKLEATSTGAGKAVIFHNLSEEDVANELLVDVVLRSAAAPVR